MMKKTVILLICVFLTAVAVPAYSQGKDVSVFFVTGDVKIVRAGSNTGIACEKGMPLHAGDWIKTGPDSSVTLAFDKAAENVITIEEDSLIVIKLDGYFKVQLMRGEMFAILENVESGETFRVLTPSAVTESLSSGWGASTDGVCTNVVVFDNRVFVCGINEEGKVDEKKYWIEEGYQRKVITFEDPGKLESVPEAAVSWFKEQVVAHHLAKVEEKEKYEGDPDTLMGEEGDVSDEGRKRAADTDEEVDLVEYLYKQRLKQ
ncbi:MAG: hypothetical protein DRP85_03435 [Candidatus Makaraimicrobium thalassicum]|nr:MAG: hypothetical protein DRP85_03435 [Candidatus Omnitrophota bacterium]